MSKAVSVLNIADVLTSKSRDSISAAASRWGAEFVEIRHDNLPRRNDAWCLWFNKFSHIDVLSQFDRVLQIDADTLIRSDAPSPFDEVPAGKIGVVCDYQPEMGWGGETAAFYRDRAGAGFYHSVGYWSVAMQMLPPPKEAYANAGFLLFDTEVARQTFPEVMRWGATVGFRGVGISDQAIISILGHNGLLPLHWLPSQWNTTHYGRKDKLKSPEMLTYVAHFCGQHAKKRRIRRTSWKTS